MTKKMRVRTYPRFLTRLFEEHTFAPSRTKVVRYSKNAMGGPKAAELVSYGTELELWNSLRLLGCPVEIYSETGKKVWWGVVYEVKISSGAIEYGLNLDSMANRVTVAYGRIDGTGDTSNERSTTAWVQDTDSIFTYGVKEVIGTLHSATDTAAEKKRDALLEIGRYPTPTMTLGGTYSSAGSVSIFCVGVWNLFGWRFPALAKEGFRVAEASSNVVTNQVSNVASPSEGKVQASGQAFDTGLSAFRVETLGARLQKVGNPLNGIRASITTSVGGLPGTKLVTGLISSDEISSSPDWVNFTFESGPLLSPSTRYWLILEADPSHDNSNHIKIHVNAGLSYQDASYAYMVGAWPGSWSFYRAGQMQAFVVGSRQTTELIKEVVQQTSQLLPGGVRILVNSGVYDSGLLADGDSTSREVLEDFMSMGSVTSPRLIPTVKSDFSLAIEDEPLNTTSQDPAYLLNRRGELFTFLGQLVDPESCPCAQWVELQDFFFGNPNLGKVRNGSRFFIEESEYDAASGILKITPRGIGTVYNFSGG